MHQSTDTNPRLTRWDKRILELVMAWEWLRGEAVLMVGKLVAPIVALFVSALGGYCVLAILLYVANGGGSSGEHAVTAMTQQAIGLSTVLISGVVNLVQAIFRAAMGAIQ